MIFEKYDPLKKQMFQVMDEKGKIVNPEYMGKLSDQQVLEAYKIMNLSRVQDKKQSQWQRQGLLLSFLTSTGQEACEVGYALNLKRGVDWFAPAYRNNAALLATGVPMRNLMLYWCGNEKGMLMPEDVKVLPINIPIGTQYSHATGLAFAEKYKNGKGIALSTIGDGGTSEGEFYEALNFAQLHNLPAIFIIENNQYAISTPRTKASSTQTLAQKSIAVAMRGLQVDGNDFFAVYATVNEAAELARSGKGPSLIECVTYRQGPHSSSDDPTVYRDEEQYQAWLKKDPLIRLKAYLIEKKLWSEKQQVQLEQEQEQFVTDEFEAANINNITDLKEVFDYQYDQWPEQLTQQYVDAQNFWNKQGGN